MAGTKQLDNPFYFWLVVIVIAEAIALTSIKYFRLNETQYKFFAISAVIYGLFIPYLLFKLLAYEGIALLNIVFNILTSIALLVVGIYIFSESITPTQWIGILMGVGGIVLIEYRAHPEFEKKA